MRNFIKKLAAAASAVALLGAALAGNAFSVYAPANAYTIENGAAKYSIAADHVMYYTENPVGAVINTFEAWIKLPENVPDDLEGGVIFGNYHNNGYTIPGVVNFLVGKNGNFKVEWGYKGHSDETRLWQFEYEFTSVDLRNDEWTHVALVRDADNGTFSYYVNGEHEETVAAKVTGDVALMKYGVGCDWKNWIYYDVKQPFFGEIRQITVYENAQTTQTIASDMTKTEITKAERDGLVSNWYFGEIWGKDKTIVDTAGENACLRGTFDKYVPVEETGNDYDYSFAVFPDIQAMTHYNNKNIINQQKWVAENAAKLNMKFAMFVGDIADTYPGYKGWTGVDQSNREYSVARLAISQLDDVIPYTILVGNHDYDDCAKVTRDTTFFNRYFPYEKYSAYPYFGGAFEKGLMDNYWITVNACGVEYLIMCLEFGPRYTVLNWADRIISEHPDARVIITTHSLVEVDGTFTDETNASAASKYISFDSVNNGDQMWEKLIRKHKNIAFTFSGHTCTDQVIMRKDTGDNGNTVTQILVNAQGAMYTSGMNTFLIAKVNEKTKTMDLCYYSPEFDMCFNEQNQFTVSFADEYNPTVGAVKE